MEFLAASFAAVHIQVLSYFAEKERGIVKRLLGIHIGRAVDRFGQSKHNLALKMWPKYLVHSRETSNNTPKKQEVNKFIWTCSFCGFCAVEIEDTNPYGLIPFKVS